MPLLLAVALSVAVSLAGVLFRALTRGGGAAASLVGTAILWSTGWAGFGVLATFFGGSVAVSRLAARALPQSDQADTEIRGAIQVVANGGFAALGSLLEWVTPGLGFWLVTVVLAAAGADTWATALGGLSPRPPRDILRWSPVAAGTSGGVTWFGTSGGLVGASLIGLVATTFGAGASAYLAAAVVGLGAMLLDSVLGSAGQARFHCPRCDLPTERRRHRCGSPTRLTRGWRWFDNDCTNLLATGAALVAGLLLWRPWGSA